MKQLIVVSFALLSAFFSHGQQINDVWRHMEEYDLAAARKEINVLKTQPETRKEALLTEIFLNTFEDNGDNFQIFQSLWKDLENPSPYIYALMRDDAVINGLGKKTTAELKAIETMIAHPKTNDYVKKSMLYALCVHYQLTYNKKKFDESSAKIGAVRDWQTTGTFMNYSGSGFDKLWDPLENPKPEATFTSAVNAPIKWFSTPSQITDAWFVPVFYFNKSTGIVFAQTFLMSDQEQEAVLAFGGAGSFKFYLNDQLLHAQEDERTLDIDHYRFKVKLQKGWNRVFVQIGFTREDTDAASVMLRVLKMDGTPHTQIKSSKTYQDYTKGSTEFTMEEHFAEKYFKEQIKNDPENILNYLFLFKCYYRINDINAAMSAIQPALDRYPKNALLNYHLLLAYLKTKDRTLILKQFDYLRTIAPENIMEILFDYSEALGQSEYERCDELLSKLGKLLGAESETILEKSIELALARQDYQKGLELIHKAYAQYPENTTFLMYKFYVVQNEKSKREAMKILEKYLAKTYNPSITETYHEELLGEGSVGIVQKNLLRLAKLYPEEQDFRDFLANISYQMKNYEVSIKYINQSLEQKPFNSGLWTDMGYVLDMMGKKEDAIKAFDEAIKHNPNLFEIREKRRELLGQKPLSSMLKRDKLDELAKKAIKDPISSDDNYEYLVYDKHVMLFPEGSSVAFHTLYIRTLNNAGVERWNRTHIGFDRLREDLYIDKAEVLKKNGQKVKAEQNGNDLVFPNLEIGDVVLIEYRIERSATGILNKDFWTSHIFQGYVFTRESRFRLIAPSDMQFNFDARNVETQPKVTDSEGLKIYEWSLSNIPRLKKESYAPSIDETGVLINVSTIDNWEKISDWYRDVAMPRAKFDHLVEKVYKEIFPDGADALSERDIAKNIYHYICDNIRYSSVSFRQSGLIPQKPIKTLSTQLGDCKDMSLLYHTLANKAGLSTNLVLVNTRDNGESVMKVPTTWFNHCIVRINFKDTTLYQELTNNKMPFGVMPVSLMNAQAIVIPTPNEKNEFKLMNLPRPTATQEKIQRTATVSITDKDLEIIFNAKYSGAATSDYRRFADSETEEKKKEQLEKFFSRFFDFSLKLKEYTFNDFSERNLSLSMDAQVQLIGAVKTIAGMKTFKIPLFETIGNPDIVTDGDRFGNFNFWRYSSTDLIENVVKINLDGYQIAELPKDFKINNDFIDYSFTVSRKANEVTVHRIATIKKHVLSPVEYGLLKSTLLAIKDAEDAYIAFK